MAQGVVVVGAGQAGAEAALALRQLKYPRLVTLLGAESIAPYGRPPLSKDFLAGSLAIEKLLLRSVQAYETAGVTLRLGQTVSRIDPDARHVELSGGEMVGYDACIIATGASARRLPVAGADLGNILALRTRADADMLRELLRPRARMVIVGAGYLGLEVAASATKFGVDITVVETAPRLLARSTSGVAADALAARHAREGVRIVLGAQVAEFSGDMVVREVVLTDGSRLAADVVVVSIGATPEISLARDAGIACGVGILADPDGRTSVPDIFAIGDCAEWDMGDGRGHLRLESVQMASQGARAAAAAIMGAARPGVKHPYFWSQQYDLKLQIAGRVPPGIATDDVLVGDPAGAFSVNRIADGVLLAVEAVNSPARYIEAQRQIGRPLPEFA
jgi:3-phenylpropionate/trans-cinnamate dioxygenase ferredoxin reductase subunit